MKRNVMLITFTALALAAIFSWGAISRNSVIPVSVVKVNPLTVEDSVICSGRVERVSEHHVFSPSAAYVSRIFVKTGDVVSVGQPLMEVQTLDSDFSGAEDELQSETDLTGEFQQSPIKTKTIVSPYAGEILSLNAIEQSYVQTGRPVAVISDDPAQLQVRLSVNESQISDIKTGQKAIITGVGFKNTAYTGVVKEISSDAKQVLSKSGEETVVEVIVSVDKAGGEIKPGYTAKAKIITSENEGVLIAPYEAVRADKDGNEYVYKLNGKKAVKTPVITNREFDKGFEITSGISKNDEIINNPDSVSNGSYVVPVKRGAVNSGD
jgi:multidrug efflux pump subunit AcrA (membrane-fusion protein)